jgi:hypothetical protein
VPAEGRDDVELRTAGGASQEQRRLLDDLALGVQHEDALALLEKPVSHQGNDEPERLARTRPADDDQELPHDSLPADRILVLSATGPALPGPRDVPRGSTRGDGFIVARAVRILPGGDVERLERGVQEDADNHLERVTRDETP